MWIADLLQHKLACSMWCCWCFSVTVHCRRDFGISRWSSRGIRVSNL